MLRDRCVQTLACALVAIALIGMFEPGRCSKSSGVSHTRLQPMQLRWGPRFDLVLAGDSRVQHGISPLEIQKAFPGRRTANFGFGGLTLTAEYLDHAVRLLDPRSPTPAIVLGISPGSLCPRPSQDFQEQLARHDSWSAEFEYHCAPVIDFLAPYRNVDFKYMLFGGTRLETVVHPTGFCGTRSLGPVNTSLVLGGYRRLFSRTQVRPEIESCVLDRVQRWSARGIRVFGVRVPTADTMRELEDAESGFDQAAFARRFAESGGVWLDLPQEGYESYDGSHLEVASAEAFTRAICRELRGAEAPGPSDGEPRYRLAADPEPATRQLQIQ